MMTNNTSPLLSAHQKIYAPVRYNNTLLWNATNLFDEISIEKTQRKKIQIIILGQQKKGMVNNEKSPLWKTARKFFDTHGFSFGITITITKNIPTNSGFGEEEIYIEYLKKTLEYFKNPKTKTLKTSEQNLEQKNDGEKNGFIVLFPQIKIEKTWTSAAKSFQQSSFELWAHSSFYAIEKVIHFIETLKNKTPENNTNIIHFGVIDAGPSIFVSLNPNISPQKKQEYISKISTHFKMPENFEAIEIVE
jgi:hypothetical protein